MNDPPPISFACPKCGKSLRAPRTAMGRSGNCTGCQTKIRVPGRPATTEVKASAAQPKSVSGAPSVKKQGAAPVRAEQPSRAKPPAASKQQTARRSAVVTPSADDLESAIDALIAEGEQQAAAQHARRLTPAEVEAAVTAKLPRNRVSMAYRVHLFLVAGAMAFLPVVYLATVAGAAWGVFYYTTVIAPELLSYTPRNRLAIFYFLAIAAPVVAGVILVLFLIKPLFFRTSDSGRRRSLTRQGEPLLFALVDHICDATGAPRPVRIDVDYQVNASAQPQGGMLSVATGKMVLTIGVPLIAGLSARQLSGVLAHEFGHFSQKVGMGASLLIRKVNFWFTRVVYQRDTMDQWLDDAIADSDVRIGLVLQMGQVCVYISRGVLWCFMMAGYAISAGLMRQMEYDADRYEFNLVGSKTFGETSQEMHRLAAAQALALEAMFQFFTKGRLADDMVLLTQDARNSMSYDVIQKIRDQTQNDKGSWFDTHPTNAQRIARADAAAAEGCFALERPARELMTHYAALCKNVTWDFYRDQLGTQLSPDQLEPTANIVAAQS